MTQGIPILVRHEACIDLRHDDVAFGYNVDRAGLFPGVRGDGSKPFEDVVLALGLAPCRFHDHIILVGALIAGLGVVAVVVLDVCFVVKPMMAASDIVLCKTGCVDLLGC